MKALTNELRGRLDTTIDARRETWLREQAVKETRPINSVLFQLIDQAIEKEAREKRHEDERIAA